MSTEAATKKTTKKPAAKKAAAKKAPAAKKAAAPKKVAIPKTPKAGAIVQNGVTRPKEGTGSAKVFDIADKLSAKTGKPAERGPVLEQAEKAGVNAATAATQFNKWRAFNGIVGRAAKEAA